MKVAFLTRYGVERASSRVRCHQMAPHLAREGVEVRFLSWGDRTRRIDQVRYAAESLRLARWADVVVLQKPPHPPALIDALAARNRRLVVDFDDAVWAAPPARDGRAARSHRELGRRLSHAIRRAGHVTTGSALLASVVRSRFPEAIITVFPSSVDLDVYDRVKDASPCAEPVVGWVGSPENLADFEPALPALREVAGEVRLRVVSSEPLRAPGVESEFEPWSAEAAVDALLGFDLGVMPLRDDERSRGRCGFKAVEYMAAGLPVVASRVGSSAEVVIDGATGFLVSDVPSWIGRLRQLAGDPDLRAEMGARGRARVEERFSVQANLGTLLFVLERRAAS